MKIAFNPSNSSKNILDLIKTNKDIIFDLKGHSIYARGVEFKGIDTNTWRDIKINNVSIGSNILDLRNGTNTILTNINGVVTINSTWRPVVDNLTSNSTTSSLSANQGRILAGLIDGKSDSDHNHDGRYVRAFGTSNDNIDSDWGQSFKTFDPIPSGTPPEKNPNISLLSIGENFNRRKQLAFVYSSDNIYYRRHVDGGFTNWKRIAFANEIPSSLKNPYALTISLNGTSQGPYDGSATKNINITPGSIGAAASDHNHDGRYVRYYTVTTLDCNNLAAGLTAARVNATNAGAAYHSAYLYISDVGTPFQIQIPDSDTSYIYKRYYSSGKWSGWFKLNAGYADSAGFASRLEGGSTPEWGTLTAANGFTNVSNYDYGSRGAYGLCGKNNALYMQLDGYFYQSEGRYRVLDTSDVAGLKNDLTIHQFLSNTDVSWYPLIWGGSSHANTSDSTGAVYKSHDRLSWQTSTQTLYATNIQTENIKNLSIGGGIFWNPNVESATDGSDAASITLVKAGVAGGTTLVLSQMNDANDTIQFKTNTAARLYHNNYPILTTQNTYVSNNKGYINGTEITQVNNADTVDGEHASAFTRIEGKYGFLTTDTAPYNYIHLFRIANSNSYSTIDCEIDFRARYHSAKLEIRIATNKPQYGAGNSSISIVKKVVNGRSCNFWVLQTVQSSDYNYYDIYYESGGWNSGSYGIIFKGSNGTLVFEHKGVNLDTLPSRVSAVNSQWVTWNDIAGKPSSFTPSSHRHDWSQIDNKPATAIRWPSWEEVTNKPSTFTPSAHTHTWTSITDKIVSGNEFNIVNAGFNSTMWFNYLPINDRSETATITEYNMGNGARGYAPVRASGFIKNGGNEDQLLRADGGVAAFNWTGQPGQPTWLWGGNDFNSYYVYNPSSFNVNTAQYLRSLGNQNCQTGRTQSYGDVYTYNTYDGNTGSPTTYTSVIGFGRGIGGTVEIAGGWCNTNLYWRSLRDCCENWYSWRTVLDSDNYTKFIGNYYWANVKVSLSPSTTTSPTVYTLTATRVCAGHNPGIDNSISCSNWFRSSGATGWYNTTYEGGWYMSDTSWIRAHNDVGIYTGGQIYSSSSIRMSNIYLEHTDEINSTSGINLNFRNSGNISLCQGGGNVGIGTMSPTQRLDVVGNIRATGQIIREGSSQVWVNGRNGALLRETSVAGYHALWSLKTTDGSWDFGEYNAGSDWNNIPVLSYITDSDYNSGNNTPTYQIKFPLASGTVALTSDIPDISTIPNPTNCYWANVKISTSANTQTTPSVSTIFANDWFRSRGDTGWYNESYGGGIHMTDKTQIRTFGGKSFYCDSQISSYGFHHLSHNNNDAVLLAGGGFKTLNNLIFLDESYSYGNNPSYTLTFHKLSGIFNNLVWVEGYVNGSISTVFSIRDTLCPEYYNVGPSMPTVYVMGENDTISIDGIGVVRIENNGYYRVGFFYQGKA